MRRSTIARITTACLLVFASSVGCNEPEQTPADAGTPDSLGRAPSPVAEFTYDPQPVTVGQPISFDASPSEPVNASYGVDYYWTIDGTQVATGLETVHIFDSPGEHTVELLVDNAGWKDTVERHIQVEGPRPLDDGPARLTVNVTYDQGRPLSNATIRVLGRDGTTPVDEDGDAVLENLPTDTRITLVIAPPNASTRYETVVIPEGVARAAIDVATRPVVGRATASVNRSETIELGGLLISVPERAFVDRNGQRLREGDIAFELTRFVGPRDKEAGLPGSYQVRALDGPVDYRFFGGIDLRASHAGEPVQLADGQSLDIVIPATYPATYEGLTLSLLRHERNSGFWLRTGDVVTELTEQSPTNIGAQVTIRQLGAWAIGTAHTNTCEVEVRCSDDTGTTLESCTVRAELQGIDGVGRSCEPSALTEGVRCQSDQNCVNCEQDPETVTSTTPSAPCYVSPEGNSICPSSSGGGRTTGQRYCAPDDSFSCSSDSSGLGHCLDQSEPSCGMGTQFCDVHQAVTDTPSPPRGICTAQQTDFIDHEGILNARRITDGSALRLPRGRMKLSAIGPDGELRGTTDILGRSSSCPNGPISIDLQ